MCRLAAYSGEPLFLEELIAKPRNSLMRQSLRAEQAKVRTHGDGFGIGWYGERDEPGVYRDATPAWGDDNLLALSQTLRSRLFFAHVRAATAGASARHNCHPFRHGRHLFMHNGQIGGFAQLRRRLESDLPDDLYAERVGATDSELLFLLAMARLRGWGHPAAGTSKPSLAQAMLAVLDATWALMRERGIDEPLRFAAVLSDGEQLCAFRIASDDKPPSLYLRQLASGTLIASEPLCDDTSGWQPLPAGAVLVLDGTCAGNHSGNHSAKDSAKDSANHSGKDGAKDGGKSVGFGTSISETTGKTASSTLGFHTLAPAGTGIGFGTSSNIIGAGITVGALPISAPSVARPAPPRLPPHPRTQSPRPTG